MHRWARHESAADVRYHMKKIELQISIDCFSGEFSQMFFKFAFKEFEIHHFFASILMAVSLEFLDFSKKCVETIKCVGD